MNTNYIYLLQEREFIKTKENIYKVGRTRKENYERFNQYPKGSILLFQMICKKCEKIEVEIIKEFKDRFNQRKDIGNEYFEGDYKIMIDIIYLEIKKEINEIEYDNNKLENINEEIKFKILCEKIDEIFRDYKNDVSFGGLNKYIKIDLINNEYKIYYINPHLMRDLRNYYENECEITFEEYIILCHSINKNVADKLQYFKNLISKKIILVDKIYNINSNNFIDKIIRTKFNLRIENYEGLKTYLLNDKFYSNIEEKLRQLLYCNMIINKELYCTMVKEDENYDIYKEYNKVKDYDSLRIDIGINDYIIITLYKINSKFYDYNTYIRKYIPYLIRWDKNNDYYIINRDYEYIGLNTKYIKYEKKGECYLFYDGNKPWDGKEYFMRMCNEYTKAIKDNFLKECLNINNFTENIMLN
jgi:hypothetical protein